MINLRRFTKFTLAGLTSLLLLSGCSLTPTVALQPVSVQSASDAKAWELKGKLLIRTNGDKVSANLFWLNTPDNAELRLTSMLGTTVLLLTQNRDGATLEVDGKSYSDPSPQRLLDGLSGFTLPIDALPYWITGQPMAGDEVEYDALNRPKTIISADGLWSISISSWQTQSGASVPRTLDLKHASASIKLQTNEWQALASAHGSKGAQ
ncbi:lipoprotein insertase outer membrane protein LolB [Shewanella litorisediminis]|uniref:Outer-membrane lipoprotein LolB n=1 Tax=Shewanella litorisediminis TaxID=1173586 RepID=A0ABX7G0M2_9GAMM|nr:lipoprotein insertase outer membrane protein LolB [Shewanella litorisediminis]MCL2918089.1 lipoprotein insertase outer membrane protein LolB [Shewanella litorisediminis]QRH00851.1 outer membrane lipoprotein LolB [Shewanella litorisediminis]